MVRAYQHLKSIVASNQTDDEKQNKKNMEVVLRQLVQTLNVVRSPELVAKIDMHDTCKGSREKWTTSSLLKYAIDTPPCSYGVTTWEKSSETASYGLGFSAFYKCLRGR